MPRLRAQKRHWSCVADTRWQCWQAHCNARCCQALTGRYPHRPPNSTCLYLRRRRPERGSTRPAGRGSTLPASQAIAPPCSGWGQGGAGNDRSLRISGSIFSITIYREARGTPRKSLSDYLRKTSLESTKPELKVPCLHYGLFVIWCQSEAMKNHYAPSTSRTPPSLPPSLLSPLQCILLPPSPNSKVAGKYHYA